MRRRLLLASAVPVLLAVALAVKLLSVGYLGGQAAGAFGSGDQASAASAASGLGIANFVERHKAPFAAGDALVLSGDYAGARTLFEASLADATPADECKVRVNLVLSIERLADRTAEAAAGRPMPARKPRNFMTTAWPWSRRPRPGALARTETRATPPELTAKATACGKPKSGCRPKRTSSEARRRNPATVPMSSRSPTPNRSRASWTSSEESAKSAQRERNDGRQRDEYLNGADSETGAEKPW